MLKMGCAKADVTPAFPTYLHGYASRNRLTAEVEEPIEVGVIALEQNGKKVLMLSVDSLGVEIWRCKEIYKLIAAETNIDYPDIMISASHTHFAPNFCGHTVFMTGGEMDLGTYPPDQKYFEFWMDKVIAAVKHALADLEEVKLMQADVPVSGIAFNRRTVRKSDGGVTTNYIYPANFDDYEFSSIDTTMHVWKFMRGTAPKAILARYGCHPVTGGYNFYGISADYPGYFKKYVQQKLGCPAFFMLGTAGDVVPMQRNNESRKDIGEVMADCIRLAERTFRDTTDFELKTSGEILKVHAPGLEGKSAEDLASAWAVELEKAKDTSHYTHDFYMTGMLNSTYNEFKGADAELDIQLLQLGDRTVVGLPFEVLTIIGNKIREVHPDAAIVSCTAGYECYLPTKDDFPKGGYETVDGTIWAEDTGDNVIDLSIKALTEFKK
ncbi:MAG: hypothetical protein E7056_04905 [Lentisphaerae bacterium]|nr:hypothetical protein [Lentisphaerota bacterium]